MPFHWISGDYSWIAIHGLLDDFAPRVTASTMTGETTTMPIEYDANGYYSVNGCTCHDCVTARKINVKATTKPPDGPFDVAEEWRKFLDGKAPWTYGVQSGFEKYAARARPPYRVIWCDACSAPISDNDNDVIQLQSGGKACGQCAGDYITCECCAGLGHSDTFYTISDRDICQNCRDANYRYCEECDAYFHVRDEHNFAHDCDCVAPLLAFSVRNDGDPPLANDTRATITLPASGEIDEAGMRKIRDLLTIASESRDNAGGAASTAYYCLGLPDVGKVWQTKTGNFTKRLSKAAHKYNGSKLDPSLLSEIGNIARDHSTSVAVNTIEVTRDLNRPAADFCHPSSCWFSGGEYSLSLCALKSNGGFALRTFNDVDHLDRPTGRAWVMPLQISRDRRRRILPTLDTESPNAFAVFNGYGDLEGYAPARIISHMAGWTYRKIGFSASPMYINGDRAFLISTQDILDAHDEISLNIDIHAELTVNA